jgi:hypothetical protein
VILKDSKEWHKPFLPTYFLRIIHTTSMPCKQCYSESTFWFLPCTRQSNQTILILLLTSGITFKHVKGRIENTLNLGHVRARTISACYSIDSQPIYASRVPPKKWWGKHECSMISSSWIFR